MIDTIQFWIGFSVFVLAMLALGIGTSPARPLKAGNSQ
jgi:hypothetical protein